MVSLVRARTARAVSLLIAVSLSACNFPGPAQTPDPGTSNDGISEEPPGGGASGNRATPTPAAANTPTGPTITPTRLPPPPDGWIEFESHEARITVYYPPGWEAVPYSDHKVDLRETGGDGWIEINVIDATNDEDFSLEYTSGTNARSLITGILTVAREDGDFGDATSMETRSGLTAWSAEGTHDLLSERELIGVIALPDRAILVIGHAPVREDTWDSALLETYQRIIWTIAAE